MNNTAAEVGHFEVLFKDRPLKFIGVTFSAVCSILLFLMACGILWYENFGSDLKRILTNRLVSSICWCVLEGIVLICAPDLILYFYRPFPDGLCYFLLIYRNAVIVRLMLLFNAIIIVRYIFIFWLRNPLNFDDEFWSFFITTWTIIISTLCQITFVILPGRQPLHYYLCKGQCTSEDENLPLKLNYMGMFVLGPSSVMHIVIHLKIKHYKKQQSESLPNLNNRKLCDISIMEKRSLSNMMTNIFGILALSIVFGIVFGINGPKPSLFNQDPQYLLIYLVHFIFPLLIGGPIVFTYYNQNPLMREAVIREVKNQVGIMREQVSKILDYR